MGPVPPTLPLGFSARLADARQGLVGRARCGLFAHQKQLLPPTLPSPCVRKVARFNCSFKGSSGPGPAEIFGTDSAPPPTLLPMARNWCGGTGVLREDANQLSSVSELICIR